MQRETVFLGRKKWRQLPICRKKIEQSLLFHFFLYIFSLSSRDRTPVKSPSKSTTVLRSTPRKRLMLGGDSNDSQMTTPERKMKSLETQKIVDNNSNGLKQFSGPLVNGLRGLSQEQLVKVVMDLISMQEDGVLGKDDKLRDVLLKKMPIADIQPLRERLSALRQNVYASLVSSDIDESAYGRAYIHLDAYEVRFQIDTFERLNILKHQIYLLCFKQASFGRILV